MSVENDSAYPTPDEVFLAIELYKEQQTKQIEDSVAADIEAYRRSSQTRVATGEAAIEAATTITKPDSYGKTRKNNIRRKRNGSISDNPTLRKEIARKKKAKALNPDASTRVPSTERHAPTVLGQLESFQDEDEEFEQPHGIHEEGPVVWIRDEDNEEIVIDIHTQQASEIYDEEVSREQLSTVYGEMTDEELGELGLHATNLKYRQNLDYQTRA